MTNVLCVGLVFAAIVCMIAVPCVLFFGAVGEAFEAPGVVGSASQGFAKSRLDEGDKWRVRVDGGRREDVR